MELLLVVAKAVLLFSTALLFFRVMGKRTLGDMEPLDFVVVIVIAEIVGAPLSDPELPVLPALVGITTVAALQTGLSLLSLRSRTAARLLEGKPVVVVENGKVLRDNLQRARVTEAELRERLREHGFLDVADVSLAILENDGMLSAIPKREASPVTPRYLGLRSSIVLALRGRPQTDGLRRAGLTEDDLHRLTAGRGHSLDEVEEVILDPRGRLHLVLGVSGATGELEGGDRNAAAGPPDSRPTED